jgi:hypothetical protein
MILIQEVKPMKARELAPISQLYLENSRFIGYKMRRRRAICICTYTSSGAMEN